MPWKSDLWDQFEEIAKRMGDGKKFVKVAGDFFSKRAALEREYAKKLLSLIKSSESDFGTVSECWTVIREETETRAKFHQELGESIKNLVEAPLSNFLREKSKQKKKLNDAARKVLGDLARAEKQTEMAKSKYERQRKKQYEHKDEYEKASFNANTNSKAKEKLARKLNQETKSADSADAEYAENVSKLQELQTKAYESEVPQYISELEDIERLRIETVKASFSQFVDLEKRLPPLVEESLNRINARVNAIDAETDINRFIAEKQSGQEPPPRAQYHPFDESAGKCLPPASVGVGFAPGGRQAGAGNSVTIASDPVVHNIPTNANNNNNAAHAASMTTKFSPRGAGTAAASTPMTVSGYPGIGSCRALYDYQAGSEQELSFKTGDIITILEKDDSGWWHGELSGKVGVFPAVEWVEELTGDSSALQSSPGGAAAAGVAGRQCKALYEYDAQEADELTIVEGEILNIEYEDSGWYIGTNAKGQHGRFPSNFVTFEL